MTIVDFFLYADLRLLVFFAFVVLFGVGRLTRVIVHEEYPLTIWMRMKWDEFTHFGETVYPAPKYTNEGNLIEQEGKLHPLSGWAKLFHCWWCMAPWIMALALVWFALSFVSPWIAVTWWVFWSWLALSYVVSIIISRDEPAE